MGRDVFEDDRQKVMDEDDHFGAAVTQGAVDRRIDIVRIRRRKQHVSALLEDDRARTVSF